jgi:hypothetical protein
MGKKWDPVSKITRAKGAESMAQALEHLLHKDKALNSNPSTTKQQQPHQMSMKMKV